jgi:hypothetical protein
MTFEEYLRWEHRNSHNVVAFEIVAPFTIRMVFDDGKEQTINFEPLLWGVSQEPLRDPAYFNLVEIKYDGLLTWPNGADFNPAFLYTWPLMEAEMVEQAAEWRAKQAVKS